MTRLSLSEESYASLRNERAASRAHTKSSGCHGGPSWLKFWAIGFLHWSHSCSRWCSKVFHATLVSLGKCDATKRGMPLLGDDFSKDYEMRPPQGRFHEWRKNFQKNTRWCHLKGNVASERWLYHRVQVMPLLSEDYKSEWSWYHDKGNTADEAKTLRANRLEQLR